MEFARYIEPLRACSYLPDEQASLEVHLRPALSPDDYAGLLSRGYRRFGWQVFRPACPCCVKCISVRILATQFKPSAAERRILRRNRHIRAELHPAFATPGHVELFNLYHRFMNKHRGWPPHQATLRSYRTDFLSGAGSCARQWLYFDGDRLVGVALMDQVPGAISLVYCYYHPDWRPDSPGTFSILNQILYAQSLNLPHAYLGYWIQDCPSMSYKGRFRPSEILTRYPSNDEPPVWSPAPAGALESRPANLY